MALAVRNPLEGVVYPPAEVVEKYEREDLVRPVHLTTALIAALEEHGDRTALVGPQGSKTYAELDRESDCFAAALLDMGLEPLDRVVFQVPNGFGVIVATMACWKADLIPVCTLAAHRAAEISFLGGLSEAKAHFVSTADNFDFPAFAREVQAQVDTIEHIVVIDGEAPDDLASMAQMIAAQDPAEAKRRVNRIVRDPYQVTAFQLSGGTTSIPKIIPRFGNEYLYNMEVIADYFGYGPDDTVFMPLQLMHNAGMIYNLSALLRGAAIAVAPSLDPPILMGVLMQQRPTVMALMAAAVERMRAANITKMIDFGHVRLVISPNAARQISEVLSVPTHHLFGMTEGLCTFGSVDDPDEMRFTTIGQPVSPADEVKILAPGTEQELAKGEVGEMVSKGPYTFHGYYKAPERNAEVFTSDGFYRSGDLMSVQTFEGKEYLRFEGRLKDIISRGGEKINAEEVEMAARKHPAIADIALVAMPDREFDERACAFVIPAPGGSAPSVEELRDFLVSEGLAKFKCPERIEAIDDFPQTDSGKLSKPKLREIILAKLEKEGVL